MKLNDICMAHIHSFQIQENEKLEGIRCSTDAILKQYFSLLKGPEFYNTEH